MNRMVAVCAMEMRGGIRAEASYFEGELTSLEEDIENLQKPSEQFPEEKRGSLKFLSSFDRITCGKAFPGGFFIMTTSHGFAKIYRGRIIRFLGFKRIQLHEIKIDYR
jgi:CRISPR/Cas system-associated endoribonuclease Cas2